MRPRAARHLELELAVWRPASMMNPRSAPLTSMAESSTSDSTSSSTRPDPSARKPFEQRGDLPQVADRRRGWRLLGWRRPMSATRNTISAPPLRPSRIRSPWTSGRSVTCSPLT